MISHIKFTQLPVSDQDRALEFYRDVLGFELVQDEPYGEGGWRWIELRPGTHAETSIVFTKRADETDGEEPALVLIEEDLHSTARRLELEDVEIVQEPQAAAWDPHVEWFWLRDSEGNIVMLENR